MRHRILTCRNHSDLRWSTKEVAFTEGFGYNGARNIFFNGTPSGRGMYSDGSGLDCTELRYNDQGTVVGIVKECACPGTDLILAPEDALVKEPKLTGYHGFGYP